MNLLRDLRADAPQPRLAILRLIRRSDEVGACLARPFSDNDNRKVPARLLALAKLRTDAVVAERNFGNQNDIGAAGEAAGGKGQSESAGKAEPRSKRRAYGPSRSANPDPNGKAVRRGPNPTPGVPRGQPDTSPSSGSNAGGKGTTSPNAGGGGGNSDFGQSQGKGTAPE